jgi:YaiO family outer membrane protein
MGRDEEKRIFAGEPKTMKKLGSMIIILAFTLFLFPIGLIADEMNSREKARQALKAGDYQTAINICQSHLDSEPDDYEFNFILARAYAFSGERSTALGLLERILELYPQNMDLMLFRSRVLAWEGHYDKAEAGYEEVLRIDAENTEAMIGLAELKSWQNKYADAIEEYHKVLGFEPDNQDIHFRIGRVYQWEGNFAKAKHFFLKACELDPGNAEYRRALKSAYPIFTKNHELRYQYKNEGFSDERGNYIDHNIVFSIKISPDIGSLNLTYSQTRRFGAKDSQFGIELYPHLWKKAYGYVDLNYSFEAVHYPRTSYLFEVYQSLLHAAEISLGYRRMNFGNEVVSVYLGSVGYYMGNYYPFVRWYYTPEDKGTNFSWFANVRRYFTKDNYLALGYGQGSRPFDIITIEDFLVKKSWIFLAEWDWYFFERIHLKIQFSHRREKDGPTRNALFVATGYRW